MKFIGKPNGKFMKGAPGSYTHGAIYYMPFKHSNFNYWELVEKPPEMAIPTAPIEESNLTKPIPGQLVEMPDAIAKELGDQGEVMMDMNQEPEYVPPWKGPHNLDQIFRRMTVAQLKSTLDDNEVKYVAKDKKHDLLVKVGLIVGVAYEAPE